MTKILEALVSVNPKMRPVSLNRADTSKQPRSQQLNMFFHTSGSLYAHVFGGVPINGLFEVSAA